MLDAGAFIALERRNRTVVALVELLTKAEVPLVTSAGVVARVWRSGSRRQVPNLVPDRFPDGLPKGDGVVTDQVATENRRRSACYAASRP